MSPAPSRAAFLVLLLLVAACGNEPESPPRATPSASLAPPAPLTAPAPGPNEPRLGPYPRSQFYIEHDLFIAADRPRCVPADEARFLGPEDEVLGLIVGGQARAYAITMLSYHHVVNDVIEGIPVAVTY